MKKFIRERRLGLLPRNSVEHFDQREKLPYLEMKLFKKKQRYLDIIQNIDKFEWLLELAKNRKTETEAIIAELERQIEERKQGQEKCNNNL